MKNNLRGKNKKIKKVKVAEKSTEYVFLLKRKKNEGDFLPVYADFSALPHKHLKDIKNYYPYFQSTENPMNGGFVFPPFSFIEPIENFTCESENSLKKLLEEDERELTRPEPESGQKTCSVCWQIYDEYFSHIESMGHKKRMENSFYHKEIKNVCVKYESEIRCNAGDEQH